jgi:2-dehydro-3-deoxygluconokinase
VIPAIAVLGEGLFELRLSEADDRAGSGYGGDAANIAVMAARLGVGARLVGRVGDDPVGRRLESFWARSDVDTTQLVRDPGAPTGIYVNESLADGGHRFSYHRRGSAGSRFSPADLRAELLDGVGLLVVTGVTLAVSATSAAAAAAAVERARGAGVTVACVVNHRPALGGDAAALARLAAASDIAVLSTEDAAGIFAAGDHDAILDALDGTAEVVVTDGDRPVLATTGGRRIWQPVPEVTLVDAAGAGDALAGAYLAVRCRGGGPDEALRAGVAASSLSVQGAGCALSYPGAAAVLAAAARLEVPA